MSPTRFACLFLALFTTLLTANSHCFAQTPGNDNQILIAKKGTALLAAPRPDVEEEPVAQPVPPILEGAACGTIAPQGLGATSIMTVTTEIDRPASRQLPIIPILLLGTLSVTGVVWALRDMHRRRRLSLWNLGVICVAIVMAAGFAWNLKHQDEPDIGHFTAVPVGDTTASAALPADAVATLVSIRESYEGAGWEVSSFSSIRQ